MVLSCSAIVVVEELQGDRELVVEGASLVTMAVCDFVSQVSPFGFF